MSTVVILGGVLGACALGDEQADCAAPTGAVERLVACVQVDHRDEPDPHDLPDVPFEAADEVPVGTRIVLDDEHAELVVVDGPTDGFREETAGTYVARVAGTYRVVSYVRVPCGGPPDEDAARTITVLDQGGDGGVASRGPFGVVGAGRVDSPQC